MKNLEMFLTAAAISLVSILAGCSDQLISPGETQTFNSPEKPGKEVVPTVGSLSVDRYFRTQLRLKPYGSFTFDASNTEFHVINSIDIENLSQDSFTDQDKSECQDILVYDTSNNKVLSCHSKGLQVTQITVENTGSSMIDLDVVLTGLKKRVPADLE